MKKGSSLKFTVLLAGVLGVPLLACILTFVKGNAQPIFEETPQQSIAPNETPQPTETPESTENVPNSNETPVKEEVSKQNTSTNKAIISNRTNLTELKANSVYKEEVSEFTDSNPNFSMPTYEKNFGYQVTHVEKSYVEAEVINTGDTNLYINNDTLGFVLYNAGGVNVSGSQILEGEGILKPGEKRLVKVSASNPDACVFTVALNGREYGQDLAQGLITEYANEPAFSDTKPLEVEHYNSFHILGWEGLPDDQWILTPKYNGMVTGNGKIKVQSLGLKILDNDYIEGLPEVKDSTGGYVLVQYRVANTTSEVMTIDEILIGSLYPSLTDRSKDSFLNFKADSEVFKDLGLLIPEEIQPNSIVDFYLPAGYPSSDFVASITVRTSHGVFENGNVGTLVVTK